MDGPYCRAEKKTDGQAMARCQGDNDIDLWSMEVVSIGAPRLAIMCSWAHDDRLSEIQRHCPPPPTVSMGTSVSRGVHPRHWESLSETPG